MKRLLQLTLVRFTSAAVAIEPLRNVTPRFLIGLLLTGNFTGQQVAMALAADLK